MAYDLCSMHDSQKAFFQPGDSHQKGGTFMKMLTLGLLTLFTVGTGLLAPSFTQAGVVTSTATLPFSGSFFDEGTSQNINLTGAVSVVSHVTFLPAATSLSIHAILPAVFGIGQ